MENLNERDIEVLMKALDSYEKEDISNALSMSLLTMGLSRDKSEDERKADFDRIISEGEKARESKVDDIILLKAKLINLKKRLLVSKMEAIMVSGDENLDFKVKGEL